MLGIGAPGSAAAAPVHRPEVGARRSAGHDELHPAQQFLHRLAIRQQRRPLRRAGARLSDRTRLPARLGGCFRAVLATTTSPAQCVRRYYVDTRLPLELSAVAAGAAERRARCTFVVVGAGYTGTEVAAQGQLLTSRLAKTMPGLAGQPIRWLLLDTAPRVLPGLDPRLSKTADRVLRRRGVEVRTGQSVASALDGSVQLSTGDKVPTRSLIWCVGVRPDALVGSLNLATNRGRLVVDEFMAVPGADGIYACGDCAAVPDLTRPGQVCGMTAQHATRQGRLVARNVAASFGAGDAQPYKHHDLGFLVDLGGLAAAANPLHIPLSGPPANTVTRAYHLYAMSGNRARVPADWALNTLTAPEASSFGVISAESVPLDVNQPRA